ncbi:GNAT family N-acetyltransferase [Streptomyces flavofungini]|uniref:GNAT family N-acetyltransferase n=1 Tax=Streptomyces flavofungini TaxID=68200 RepID=UPI0034DEBC1A
MITATPLSAPPSFVRSAREEDAPALAALSEPFARSGALRARPSSLYAAQAAEFLVLITPEGEIEGCVGLSVHACGAASSFTPACGSASASGSGPASGPVSGPASTPGFAPVAADHQEQAGVLYNFCVADHRQGRGVGAELLRAALREAHARSLNALFTATTGDGDLFIRHGFTPTTALLAPPTWAKSLDPRRNAQVFVRPLAIAELAATQ